jgi:hypothetical protein
MFISKELSELDDLEMNEAMSDHDCTQEKCPVCYEYLRRMEKSDGYDDTLE